MLVRIFGTTFVPAISSFDDLFQRRPVRHPIQYLPGLACVRYKFGRVAGAPGAVTGRDIHIPAACDGIDYLAHGIALASAEVEADTFALVEQIPKCQHVCFCKVGDMDVIPDRRAIGRGVVSAIYINRGSLTQGRFYD